MVRRPRHAPSLLLTSVAILATPALAANAEVVPPAPSLVDAGPVGRGRSALGMGGGAAVLLPYYFIEGRHGVGPALDLSARFETVLGLFHFPQLGVRYAPWRLGSWRMGAGLAVAYSFFGIATDNVNLTSTLYLTPELAASGPLGAGTIQLFTGVGGEIDLARWDLLDQQSVFRRDIHYDATSVRIGVTRGLGADMVGHLLLRVRVPTETLRGQAQDFYLMPFLELGASWAL